MLTKCGTCKVYTLYTEVVLMLILMDLNALYHLQYIYTDRSNLCNLSKHINVYNFCHFSLTLLPPFSFSDPCKSGGTCMDGIGEYQCLCVDGFGGEHCEVDIDECESSPCQNGARCYDFVDSYTCDCLPGFSGVHCQINDDDCSDR